MRIDTAEPGLDADGIAQRLHHAVETSEMATLAIGRLLDRIVQLATNDPPELAKINAGLAGLGIAGHIAAVTGAAKNFTGETQSFLERQREFIQTANTACRCINKCADSVAALMRKSHVLAINMQIESARLRVSNTAFNVIGQEMSQFSVEVRRANESIVEALKQLSDSLPQLEGEAVGMGQKVSSFDDHFKQQLDIVEAETLSMRRAQGETMRIEAEKNHKILELSNLTLSELQFQDPMAQSLRNVANLLSEVDFESLKKPDSRVNGSPEEQFSWLRERRSAGELELF